MEDNDTSRRIAFLIGGMARGGAERVISLLANNYAKKGWRVDILLLLEDRQDYELNSGVNIIAFTGRKGPRILRVPYWLTKIRAYLLKYKPDRVVAFVARINILTLLACFRMRKKIIISERNDPRFDGRGFMVKAATYLLYPLSRVVVFQTRTAQRCFPKAVRRKSVIITNPVYVPDIFEEKKEKRIITVGRLCEQKNHKLLLEAFSSVVLECPDYSLHIFGGGGLRSLLEKKIIEMRLSDKVFLEGEVANIHERVAEGELFVLSSNYEGLSNALMEAMALGLPCISTDCAGCRELIDHGVNGLIVPVGDAEGLATAMIRVLKDKNLSEALGKNAGESSKETSFEVVMKSWEEIIEIDGMI